MPTFSREEGTMKRAQILVAALVVLLALSAMTTLTLAQGPTGTGRSASPLANAGTAFTYQGQLKSGGVAVNGTCDLQFGLWDALTLGAQVGVTQTQSAVTVTNGLFTRRSISAPTPSTVRRAGWRWQYVALLRAAVTPHSHLASH
jgi:hypothetical protein